MAKTLATSTRSPNLFSIGQGIYFPDAEEVAELLNYSNGYGGVANLISTRCGSSGWGTSGNEVRTHDMVFPTVAAGAQGRYSARVWIDEDAAELHLRSVATFPAANTGEAVFTVGGASSTHSYAAGATTVATSTLATSATGTGWQDVSITIEHLTGALVCTLDAFRIRTQPITAPPDPVIE